MKLKYINDVLFLAKTGLGKTLTFQLPSLIKEGTAIVVSPLLSLMEDQINNTEKIGINSKTLNSTLGKKAKAQVLNQLENNEVDLLYIAPESLLNQELLDFLIEKVKTHIQNNQSLVELNEETKELVNKIFLKSKLEDKLMDKEKR